MSDETPQPGAEDNPTPEPEAQETPEPEGKTFDEAYVKKLRDEAAGYRVRLKEIEDAQKSDEQKQAERLAELDAKVKEYETRDQIAAWKSEVVEAAKDLTPEQKAMFSAALAGSTKEEIEAHAKTLLPLIAKKPGGPIVPGAGDTPKPQGASTADIFAQSVEAHFNK